MWIKLYNIISFLFLVFVFVILFFMLDMLVMTITLENTFFSAIISYVKWLYLYVSVLGTFLLKYGVIIYSLLFILLVFYSYKRYKKICLQSYFYIFSIVFYFFTNTLYRQYIFSQINLVSEKSKLNLLVEFNYTNLGIFINISTIFVVFILLYITVKYIKSEVRKVV